MEEFVETFKKNYVTMLHPMVEKPVKMALLRGTRSRLPGVRKISKILMAQIQTLKLTESKSGLPPWWKPFWSRVRNAVKRAGRMCHDIEDDTTSLMQYLQRIPAFAEYKTGDRFWLARMLQRELEMLQTMQKGVGAKIRQLLQLLNNTEGMINEGIRDLVDMLHAVVVSFQDDDVDESKPDEIDQWTQAWTRRIEVWLDMETFKLSNVVTIEDSADDMVEEGATKESAFVEMVVEFQRHLMTVAIEEEKLRLAKSAAIAQEWEDWIVKQAMDNPASPKRQRTVSTQVDPGMIANAMPLTPNPAAACVHVPVPASGVPGPDDGDLKDGEYNITGLPQGEVEGNGSVPVLHPAPVPNESENGVHSVHDGNAGVSGSADAAEVVNGGNGVDVERVAATVPETTQDT